MINFFNFKKTERPGSDDSPAQKITFSKRMRLHEAEVDIMFIVKNRNVLYINDYDDSLYQIDKDGDLTLVGRVVNFTFQANGEVIEVFVAFDENDSYTMFTMGVGRDERLHYVARAIVKFMADNAIANVFSLTSKYLSEYEYTFRLFKKGGKHFMVNNGNTQAYLISSNLYKNKDVDALKTEFWKS